MFDRLTGQWILLKLNGTHLKELSNGMASMDQSKESVEGNNNKPKLKTVEIEEGGHPYRELS